MANLFKGYIKSIGKRPLGAIKGGEYLAEPPTDSDYVGVLKPEYIQVDIDDSGWAYKLFDIIRDEKLKCDVLKTSRGLHFYFKNTVVNRQGVHIYSACGIPADYGLGTKDRVVPLKTTKTTQEIRYVEDVPTEVPVSTTTTREWLQQYNELDSLPEFLLPISKYEPEILNGVNRNNTLFEYILKLQTKNLTKDGIRKTCNIVNRYIFKEPLTQREVDTITRDDAFSEELFYDAKGNFRHDTFGNYMLNNNNIMLINGTCNIYTDAGLYTNDPMAFEKAMLAKIPALKDTQRKEVYKYICLMCRKTGTFADAKYIGVKNGILDLETMQLLPYTPALVINNKINIDYKPDAKHDTMDNTLSKVACHDKQIRSLLEEMIGYSVYRSASLQTCFILTGEGSNGKSTILNCIKTLLGKDNYTSLDLRELEDTFKPAELYNKLANLGDDISAKYLDNASKFKKIVTGNSFMAQRKYMQPFELESYATQIFCANEMPNVSDKTDGFSRRITIIPFKARFSSTDVDYDPFIESKLLSEEAMEYLLKISIDALKRILVDGFTKSDAGEEEKKEYIKTNNNVLDWLETDPKIENESAGKVYLAYSSWCHSYGCIPIKNLNFGREIKKLGFVSKPKSINGEVMRIYCKKEG